MVAERDEVSALIMAETAKPLELSYKEFDRTVEYIHKTISAYRELTWQEGVDQPYGNALEAHIERTPLGVTLCMSPFNYPLNETFTSLIPALIMGNTTVVKPARFGVLLFEPLLSAFKECFPPGVVNFVYGDGREVISPIMESGLVDTLAFIGSTKVANAVSSLHPAPNRLNKILGLGAHNPAIILDDADLPGSIKEIMAGSLTFNGQRCTTLALHFVDARKGSEYAELVAEKVAALKVGRPDETGVQITALAEGPSKLNYLQELIRDACDKGAQVINPNGGDIIDGAMVPAVLYPVNESMRIFREEQFGPIVPIVPFSAVAEVVSAIRASNYGQQISIFGEDRVRVGDLVNNLKNSCARININSQCQRGPDELPFTGKKDSALGTLSIVDALKAFSCPTVISRLG
jgi:glyceraldehyde-3-phosphate dehydrogenase (NADP+)